MIVPEFKGRVPAYWNANEWGVRWHEKYRNLLPRKCDLVVPENCADLVAHAKKMLGADYLYGGWMENRSVIWAESYLKQEQKFLHLGDDIWVPAGTKVAIDRPGIVIETANDAPLVGGWGARVMFQLRNEDVVLLYGHLSPHGLYRVGTRLEPGDIFAQVGTPEENGHWAPHIHVQAMSVDTYEYLLAHPEELDGYGLAADIKKLARRFPDPLRFVELV